MISSFLAGAMKNWQEALSTTHATSCPVAIKTAARMLATLRLYPITPEAMVAFLIISLVSNSALALTWKYDRRGKVNHVNTHKPRWTTFNTDFRMDSGIQASACAWRPLVLIKFKKATFLSPLMFDSIQKFIIWILGNSVSIFLSNHLHSCQVLLVTMFWPAASLVWNLKCTISSRPCLVGVKSTKLACRLNSWT